jgi:hypothetical protein
MIAHGRPGIARNEAGDQYATDASIPDNGAELPQHAERCTSLSH